MNLNRGPGDLKVCVSLNFCISTEGRQHLEQNANANTGATLPAASSGTQ